MYYDLGVGFGLSAKADWPLRPLAYAMAEAGFGAGPVFSSGWRAGGGGRAGLLLRPAARLRLLAEASLIEYWLSPRAQRLRLTASWSLSRNIELRASLDRRAPDDEASGMLLFYF
jgi:hypothetical protein